ncbi:predicted protein [Plenodomus lingam JN3]|uniref:Predicted protein n=1 Tax=Leptosphaeria maculans (strain JN3 / isolate v23.1.3 / race Av1-4-5-6-7-8) TaxID=985895 RepID=E5A2W7_LEPMJ|nr:predicted protein [Plenodomus lingam JN3]CBX97913.1 predicted protein [Plenodomus lingam JN3]
MIYQTARAVTSSILELGANAQRMQPMLRRSESCS